MKFFIVYNSLHNLLLKKVKAPSESRQKFIPSVWLWLFFESSGCYPALHMAVRRQSSVRASVTGQANVLAQRKTNSSIEAALAALRFGIPGVPLRTIARFTCHLPDQTPTQTEPQLMRRIIIAQILP